MTSSPPGVALKRLTSASTIARRLPAGEDLALLDDGASITIVLESTKKDS